MELYVDIQKRLPDFTLEVAFQAGAGPLGILGASGSGKSMTLRCIAGLTAPDKGRIVLNGRVLFDSAQGINLPSQQRKCGFLFQNYALFPHLTVAQNITLGLAGDASQAEHRVHNLLELFNLAGLAGRYPRQLSGGQQQRVALARALAVQPEVLLLDEPFTALDEHLRAQMEKQLLENIINFPGQTLFVSHNLAEVYRVCPNLVIISKGKLIAQGATEEIFRHPPTLAAAQITGCKNLTALRGGTAQHIEAAAWGCQLQVAQPLTPGLTHVGIRAHQLRFVEDAALTNTFPCRVVQTCESPHHISVLLSLAQQDTTQESSLLQVELSKEKWLEQQSKPLPWLIQLQPEKLFLCTGNITEI